MSELTNGGHRDTRASEPSAARTDCGLRVAEERLYLELESTVLCLLSVWSSDFAYPLCALRDRIEAERSPRPSDTGAAVPGGRGDGGKEYSVDAVVARGLSDTTESSESFCSICSVLERGLRATVRQRAVGLDDDAQRRLLDDWLRVPYVARYFAAIFNNLNHPWWEHAPAAVVDLCSELLEDPRVRAGLGEVAGRLPASGALCPASLDATLCGHYLQHTYEWAGGGGGVCEHCAAVPDLRLRFAGCEDSRRVEASLARVRSAILQGFDQRYQEFIGHRVVSGISLTICRALCGVSLDACLHRVRVLLLHRVGVTRPVRIAAHRCRLRGVDGAHQ